jgi:hypothetical protein
MKQAHGILLFVTAVLLSIFSIYNASPPEVVPASAPDTVFSATRAFAYLKQIARAPHSMGTEEHARVRTLITEHLKAVGLETTIQHSTATGSFRGRPMVFAGDVYNIVARLKGTGNGKAVAVMCHYDSHPNTPGAGDDGAAVAAMMETARILKNGRPLQNDVWFVFTDGEESGLIGAKAFLTENPVVKNIGVVLNFEARGSAGISNMFEVNNDNGWVMEQFAKAAAHPFANSLSFEVYKLLPNDTDFTLFKNAGITGLNHAFIDNYQDYHSMHDTPENLDQRSLQHHGANMLSLARHFGHTDLSQTKAADKTYFNLLGSWLIMYPDGWNVLFVVLACILAIVYLVMLLRSRQMSAAGIAKGVGFFLLALLAMAVATWLIQLFIKSAYPYNSRFYDNNSYNSKWYFLAVTAAGLGVFSLIYQWAVRKASFHALYSGILIVQLLLMVLMKLLMPTATYLFCFPLILALLVQLVLINRKDSDSRYAGWLSILFSVPAIFLFAPTIYAVFIAFGLGSLMPGGVVVSGLLLGFLLPVLLPLLQASRYFLRTITIGVFLIAMLVADRKASFTMDRPLQSNIWYLMDADKKQAMWFSDHKKTDDFNKAFFAGAENEMGNGQSAALENKAPVFDLLPPQAVLQRDTIAGDNVTKIIHCYSRRKAVSIFVAIDLQQPLVSLQVNGREAERKPAGANGHYTYRLQYYALPDSGFYLTLKTRRQVPITLTLTDRSMGIPQTEYSRFPLHVIPAEGRTSNTTQVRKSFGF